MRLLYVKGQTSVGVGIPQVYKQGKICSSIRSPKTPTRPTVPHLTVTIVM